MKRLILAALAAVALFAQGYKINPFTGQLDMVGSGSGGVSTVGAGPTGALSCTGSTNVLCDIDTAYVPSKTGTNTWTGANSFAGASATAPAQTGTSLPATCTVGDQYFKSDATAGSNLYGCTSTNTWTLLGGSSGYPSDTTPPTYLWDHLCRVSTTGWLGGFQSSGGTALTHSSASGDPMCSGQYVVGTTDVGLIYSGDNGDKRVRLDGAFDITFDLKHPNDTTKELYIGILQGVTVTNDGCWIKAAYVDGTTTYKLYCRQGGTNGAETDMVSTLSTARQRFRLRRSGSTVYASINGGTEYSTTDRVPTTTSVGAPAIRWISLSGGSATLYFYRFGMAY